jgi:hypothetical protein
VRRLNHGQHGLAAFSTDQLLNLFDDCAFGNLFPEYETRDGYAMIKIGASENTA